METFDQLGFNECMAIVMKYAEKPCVTSVAGHAAHGKFFPSSFDFNRGGQLSRPGMHWKWNGWQSAPPEFLLFSIFTTGK